MGLMVSPITGAEGNTEFLAHLRAPDPTRSHDASVAQIDALVSSVVDEATRRA